MGREFAYQAVYRYLNALIEEASRGGQPRLPSLRALSRRLRVSLATVQTAYGLLENEGRVLSVPKSGYFANPGLKAGRGVIPVGGQVGSAQPLIERALFAHERRLARQRARSMLASQVTGGVRLRHALAERYTRSSRQCWRPDDVHLGPDVEALLETLLAALALQGSTVMVASPCCWRLLRVLQRVGMRVLEVPLNDHGSPDLDSLARLLGHESVRMVIMPSCLGLPMGRLMPQQDQQQLAKLLALHPVWLLENDLDSEHCFTMPPGSRLRDWVDPHRLLVLGSLEAAVGVEAPYAYVLGRHTALAEAFALRGFQLAPLRLQALAQLFSKGEIDEQLGRQRADQHARMQHFYQALQRHLGTQLGFTMPEGGRVVWVQLKQPVPTDRLLAALAGSALLAIPGEQFSVQGRYQHCLALTWVGEHSEGLVEPLYLLAQALELRCGVQLP